MKTVSEIKKDAVKEVLTGVSLYAFVFTIIWASILFFQNKIIDVPFYFLIFFLGIMAFIINTIFDAIILITKLQLKGYLTNAIPFSFSILIFVLFVLTIATGIYLTMFEKFEIIIKLLGGSEVLVYTSVTTVILFFVAEQYKLYNKPQMFYSYYIEIPKQWNKKEKPIPFIKGKKG